MDELPPNEPHPQQRQDPQYDKWDKIATAIEKALEKVAAARTPTPAQQHLLPPDIPADPHFNWSALKFPSNTNFPVPCEGQVQLHLKVIATKLATMNWRDQHEAKFVLAMGASWPNLDDEGRSVVWQRIYIYALVAQYGWPTAIKVAALSGSDPYVPPGLVPIPARAGRRRYRQPQ